MIASAGLQECETQLAGCEKNPAKGKGRPSGAKARTDFQPLNGTTGSRALPKTCTGRSFSATCQAKAEKSGCASSCLWYSSGSSEVAVFGIAANAQFSVSDRFILKALQMDQDLAQSRADAREIPFDFAQGRLFTSPEERLRSE